MQNKYLSIVQKLNYTLFIVAVCMLPFPTRLSLYAWVGWMISWVFEFRFLKKENTIWHKGIVPVLLLLAFIVWELISCIWAIDLKDAIDMVVRHLSFVAIAPIAIWGVNSYYDWNKIAKCFIISSIASIFIYGIYVYILDFTPYIKLYHELPEFVHSWTFFGDRISLFKHRFYYGTILNLAIVSLLQIQIQQLSVHRHRKSATAIIFAGLLILALGVVWTGSRANMLTLLIVGAVAMIQPLRGQTRALVSAMVCVGGIVIASLLFTLHPRFEQLELEHITERATYQIHEIEPRINIWYGALQNVEDYFWKGVGAGGNTEYLKPIYAELQWQTFYERQFNAHNQYLGTFINLGIFGLLFFLLIWLLYPFWYNGRLRQFATLVAMIIGLNMLTENMLDRIEGVIAVCCACAVIALISRPNPATTLSTP